MEIYIVIVAGGKGARMQSAVPKQFIEVAGKPLLLHTFEAFSSYYHKATFVLVLPGMEIGRWKQVRYNAHFTLPHILVEGGPTRFHSVKNGLAEVPNHALVAIHDAARPLVSNGTLKNCFRTASIHGNAVPVVPVTDSLRRIVHGISKAQDRSNYFLVQTPQVFQSDLLKKAYNCVYDETFADDATVFEASGHQIVTVEGNAENIKITRPADLGFAAYLLSQRKL